MDPNTNPQAGSTGVLNLAMFNAVLGWIELSNFAATQRRHIKSLLDLLELPSATLYAAMRAWLVGTTLPPTRALGTWLQIKTLFLARRFLDELHGDTDGEYAAYWAVLPQPDSPDLCTPDFFSEEQLGMLQWPPLVEEARKRTTQVEKALSATVALRGAADAAAEVPGGDGSGADATRELQWAVWTILSRVLTVVDPVDPAGHKLLIPFMDMFNHRGGTKHYLTGRTDGMLRVVAGAPVRAGEQIFIKYGTDQTSNAEFVAHYGFVDPKAEEADRRLVRSEPQMVPALGHSTLAEDEASLAQLAADKRPYKEQLAVGLRMALKRAALKEGLLEL